MSAYFDKLELNLYFFLIKINHPPFLLYLRPYCNPEAILAGTVEQTEGYKDFGRRLNLRLGLRLRLRLRLGLTR